MGRVVLLHCWVHRVVPLTLPAPGPRPLSVWPQQAYMWCEPGPPPSILPAVLAVPWVRIAAAIDMPPILTYASYNLCNWRRLDAAGPVRLGNIVCLQVCNSPSDVCASSRSLHARISDIKDSHIVIVAS
ncbi:hypothetical protein Vretifemale_5731 [Volvox reticuliferus]|uniref:Uncharacterized protein n=1 Tax=Volvox reticuliferus TaxID=1737510 RepID=A0A8J4CA69_9CHLO|nr:hypothetical protein Vretifemale_5731 [Volvox reticuliferus]